MGESGAPPPVGDLDWEPARARDLGERALAIWEELLERLPDLPVSRGRGSDEVRRAVLREVPEEGLPTEELVAYLREVVLEHSMYPGHPRFMAYISGAGTVPGAAADLVAAAVNQNLGGWRLSPAATAIEEGLTRWFARAFGLPETAGGLVTSGGAMANFIGLKAARDAALGHGVRERGVAGSPPLGVYASEEVHVVVDRAADMLGLGTAAVRKVPVDEGFHMPPDGILRAIERDRAEGILPMAVVATAGTVATGAVDPLEDLAAICEEGGVWLHVDAAYGGPAVLAPDLRPRLRGIERADSIAFDPHKWLSTPLSGGCVLVRDVRALADSFSVSPAYVHEDKRRTGHGQDRIEMGPEFSRGFSALKIWVSLLAHGRAAYARRISHDVALARYLARRAEERPEFEPAAPVELSIACFRYVPPDLPDGDGREAYLDALNERLMTELQLDGRVFPSNAVLRGRFVLRACIVNFRTEAEDVDALLDVAAELGGRIDREMRPAALRGEAEAAGQGAES